MKPLIAHCRSCHAHLQLREIARAKDGTCSNCGVSLSERWTILLVEECEAIEQLADALVRSLRRLCGLPGNLEVHPEELLSNISSEVPWRQHIETEPGLVAAEIARLTGLIDRGSATPPALADDLRVLASRLIGLATVLEANQEATDPTRTGVGHTARDAAGRLEAAAQEVERGDTDTDTVRRTLADAATATNHGAE